MKFLRFDSDDHPLYSGFMIVLNLGIIAWLILFSPILVPLWGLGKLANWIARKRELYLEENE